VRNKLDAINVSMPTDIVPQTTIIVADTTFWGRSYGVCVFRSWNLKRNIWWNEVSGEKVAHYYYGRKILEERGWYSLLLPWTADEVWQRFLEIFQYKSVTSIR